MTNKSQIGQLGENFACKYLLNKEYKILFRNYRKPWGEIDIIAKQADGTLVFVEVKTMRQSFDHAQDECGNPSTMLRMNPATCGEQSRTIAALLPEDNLTAAKLKKLQRTAQLFAGSHQDLINKDRGWRIDLLAILINEAGTSVSHYENI